jgi:hypothetical protein
MFAAAVGHRSGRATPSLRDAPQRQSMEIVGRETIYRNRNAVQTNPATSDVDPRSWLADVLSRINDHPASRLGELLPWNCGRQHSTRPPDHTTGGVIAASIRTRVFSGWILL